MCMCQRKQKKRQSTLNSDVIIEAPRGQIFIALTFASKVQVLALTLAFTLALTSKVQASALTLTLQLAKLF